MEFLWFAAGIAVGSILAWLFTSRKAAAEEARTVELRKQLEPLQARLEKLATEHVEARTRLETLQKMESVFKTLATDALQTSQEQFLTLANSRLADQVVAPLHISLGKVEEGLKGLEGQRAGIKEQVVSLAGAQGELQRETTKLVEALKNSSVRGRWGEIQLRRILELSGMQGRCDFDLQASVATEEGQKRPDVVVHLPGKKSIVVDSKAPLDAFLQALEATTEEDRVRLLKKHAQDVRTQIFKLGLKSYSEQFERSPEFVILFLPGESFFSAAIQYDPSLFEEALAKNVILASPTTLIAMLKSIHYGWQQEMMAENAQKISEAGRELHDRAAILVEHLAKMGKSLGAAVDDYNKTVGSLESRVLPAARQLKELGASGVKQVPEVPLLEKIAREPAPVETPRK